MDRGQVKSMKRFLNVFGKGSGVHGLVPGTTYRGLNKAGARATVVVLVLVLFIGAFVTARWSNPVSNPSKTQFRSAPVRSG